MPSRSPENWGPRRIWCWAVCPDRAGSRWWSRHCASRSALAASAADGKAFRKDLADHLAGGAAGKVVNSGLAWHGSAVAKPQQQIPRLIARLPTRKNCAFRQAAPITGNQHAHRPAGRLERGGESSTACVNELAVRAKSGGVHMDGVAADSAPGPPQP